MAWLGFRRLGGLAVLMDWDGLAYDLAVFRLLEWLGLTVFMGDCIHGQGWLGLTVFMGDCIHGLGWLGL
jgi:hypothetical protein